jgi:hypothetical protein
MKTATFVRFLPSFRDGSLYQLSHPITYCDEYKQRLTCTLANVVIEGEATQAYPANLNGHFMSWIALPRSRIKGKNHKKCLEKLGFKVVKET